MKKGELLVDLSIQEGWTKERKFQRCECSLPAKYHYLGKWYPARAITIGAGGIFLACRVRRILKNDLVDLAWVLDGKQYNAISRVVWNNFDRADNSHWYGYPPGFAIEFEKVSGEARAAIDHFVKRSLRTLLALDHELKSRTPDRQKINKLFLALHPKESTRLSHIRKSVQKSYRHFRLRKMDGV